MSDAPPEFPGGLPVLFFYEDPEEKRQRIAGAQPPQSPVSLPRLDEPGQPPLDYPLVPFPWEPWGSALQTQSGAQAYAAWLTGIAQDRLAAVLPLLARAGAPAVGLREDPARLAELGRWLQRAFPAVAAPLIGQGFLTEDPWSRLGWAYRASSPRSNWYSRQLDALVGSVAHDLALIVADCVSASRPGLAWQPFFDPGRRGFVLGFDAERPQTDLIAEIADFLTQTAARPRGVRGRELREWYGGTLLRGYQRVVSGAAVPDARDVFPDLYYSRGEPRRALLTGRPELPAPPGVAASLDMFRAAGWFETFKRSSAQLARSAQASWLFYEGTILPDQPDGLHASLLLLDPARTWSDDIDAGVQPGDRIYLHLLDEISKIRGKALGSLWDTGEDWSGRPHDLKLSFRTRSGRRELLIPEPGRYLSAAVFTGLNDLSPADGPRLWFVDQGPPVAVVTRATPEERTALQKSTGLRLDPDPPSWWTGLTPLPEGRPQIPPAASPVRTRSTSARKGSISARAGQGGAGNSGSRKAAGKPGSGKAGGSGKAEARPGSSGSARSAPRRRPAAEQDTAGAVFTRMMRDLVAPAMRQLGFTVRGTGWFTCSNGDYGGSFSTQRSRFSTRSEVMFWVHLSASHVQPGPPYWERQLLALIPGDDQLHDWTVRADSPAEPVAELLLGVFRSYGWPALQAALDSPGFPPDPGVTWPRSFPPQPDNPAGGAAGPNLGPLAWPLRRTGQRGDLLADITDPDQSMRAAALSDLGRVAGNDAEVEAILLNRLEHDPGPGVRRAATRCLRHLAGQPHVRAVLQAAAADDEDVEVRWEARYALRLAALG